MKKKIVYILHGLAVGGTEAFVLNVVSALNREKYDITFVLALDDNGKTHQFHEDKVLNMGIKVYRTCDLNGIKKWILHYKKLKRILQSEGPFDVIHCNMDLFNGINLLVAKKAGVPVRICHSHNAESQYNTNRIKKAAVRIYRMFMRNMIRLNATVMLGCSKAANDYLYGKKWKNDKRCHVLYNGINIQKFRLKKEEHSNRKRIMTVGRFAPQKNPDFICEIIYELSKIRDDFLFQWIGDGEMKRSIEIKIEKYGLKEYINLLGTQTEIPNFMRENEYFLFPSLFEGLPITLIEAQSAGLFCFVSNTVTKEVDAGLCEYYPLEIGAEEWAKRISDYMDHPPKRSINSEKLKQFDIRETIKRLEVYYG